MTLPVMQSAMSVMNQGAGAPAVVPWYLSGGISAANCIGAYRAKGAADIATSYVNLANPGTYNLTNGTAPAFDTATGWAFNGTTNNRYLRTGITLDSVNWSAIVRVTGITTGTRLIFGCKTAVPDARFAILPNLSNTIYYEYGVPAPGWLAISYNFSYGVLGFSGASAYRDGTKETGAITTVSYPSGVEIYIGAWNSAGSPDAYMIGNIQAIAFYNAILSDEQMALLTTAINAL